jgi:hypothetical protein
LDAAALECEVPFAFPADRPWLQNIFYAVRHLLRGQDIHVSAIAHEQYCEKYTLARGGVQAVIRLYYNGRERISRIDRPGTTANRLAADALTRLQPLQGKQIVVDVYDMGPAADPFAGKPEPAASPDHSRESEFFREIQQKCKPLQASIAGVKHHGPYHDEYEFLRGGKKAMVHFYFNKAGRYTRCMPDNRRSTSVELLGELAQALGT